MIPFWMQRWFGIRTKEEFINFRRRLSILYAFLGWNCFGLLFYKIMKKEIPDDPVERRLVYRSLAGTVENTHVYQIKGLTLVNEFDLPPKSKVDQIEKENRESKN